MSNKSLNMKLMRLKLERETLKFMSDLNAIDPRIFEEIENENPSSSIDWTIASIIWENALVGNEKALAMVHELFVNKDEIQMFLEHSKLEHLEQPFDSAQGPPPKIKTITLSAIAIIGFGLEDKHKNFFQLERRK